MQINNKDYIVKVSTPAGVFIDTIPVFNFNGFRKQMNGGLGSLTLTIPKKMDDFDELRTVKINNRIDITVIDGDNAPVGQTIYSGWISSYGASVVNGKEKVQINCLGYWTKLATSLLKNSTTVVLKTAASQTLTTSGDAAAGAVETVFKAIIDRYVAEANNPVINYSATSVGTTGQTLTYIFDKNFIDKAVGVCVQAAPTGWYTYCGADNVIQLKAKPSSPKHTFIFGKDFISYDFLKDGEKVINKVLFESNNTSSPQIMELYTDATSISQYDDRYEVIVDSRVTDVNTANNIGNGEVSAKKDAKIRLIVEILDNNLQKSGVSGQDGYDIEIIEPGDTCKFRGFNDITAQNFTDNMQIVSVDYTPSGARLEIEQLDDNIARDLAKVISKPTSTLPTDYMTDYTVGTVNYYTPTLLNSWTSYPGWQAAGFHKDGDGMVRLFGLIRNGTPTVGTTLLQLPPGFRPGRYSMHYVSTAPGTTAIRIDIQTDGTVVIADSTYTASSTWLSLDGIVFPEATALASNAGNGQRLFLQNGWIRYQSINWTDPFMYVSPTHGKVYLGGLLKNGTSTSTFFTLPDPYRPHGGVMTTMVNGSGFGRLDINQNGAVVANAAAANNTNMNSIHGARYFPRHPLFLINPTYQNGWTDYFTASYEIPDWDYGGYFKDSLGIVHLQGLVANGTVASGTPIFTLPAGYWPAASHVFTVVSNNTVGCLEVLSDGRVCLRSGSLNYVSLTGVEFLAAPY